MRRLLMLVLLVAGMTIPAACGDGEAPFAMPTISTKAVDEEPTITSSTAPPSETRMEIVTEGTGRRVAAGELLVMHMKAQVWDTEGETRKPFVDTFPQGGPPLIGDAKVFVPAFEQELPGVPIGSRVLLAVAPQDGFGSEGNKPAGIEPDSALIFVIDLVDSVAPDAVATGEPVALPGRGRGLPQVGTGRNPTITVPESAAPHGLVAELLQRGTGAKVGIGQTILAQYSGAIWRTGEQFDSSWKEGRTAFNTVLIKPSAETGGQGVIEGWVKGLTGRRVGSRVLLVVPPNLGYGETGNAQAGIKSTDTLVFVVDIVGVYGTPV